MRRPSTIGLIGVRIATVLLLFVFVTRGETQSKRPSARLLPVRSIGCESSGQVEREAPPEGTRLAAVSSPASRQLAYYRSAWGLGVLAPLGWHCFSIIGSSGETLYVSESPIDSKAFFSRPAWEPSGPVIRIARRFGGTSGRTLVAEVVARVFPAYRSFAREVTQYFDVKFPSGPYPADKLTYKSKSFVRYTTPAGHEGLGTHHGLLKSDLAIEGAAAIVGPRSEIDLLLLAIKLPPTQRWLTPGIIHDFEQETHRPAPFR